MTARQRASSRNRRRRFIYLLSLVVGGLCLALLWLWNRDRPHDDGHATSVSDDESGEPDEAFEELPETPSRDEILAILRKLTPAVLACRRRESGTIRIHLAIAGKSGTVTDASVIKQFAGTDFAKCATSVVEQAQFPRFRKKTLTVVYPVTLPETNAESPDAAVDADSK